MSISVKVISVYTNPNATHDYIDTNSPLGILGSLTRDNIPTKGRVRLYSRSTGKLVSTVATDEQGNFVFRYLRPGLYYMLSVDPLDKLNVVAQDFIRPEYIGYEHE